MLSAPEIHQRNVVMQPMDDIIIQFITDVIPLSEEEISIVREHTVIMTFKKNYILLSEGEFAKEHYFILKGCVRSYYLIEGEEKTTEFFTENQGVVPVSHIKKQPSEYYLSCLEDCVLSVGTPERTDSLIEKVPKLKFLIMQMNNELLAEKQISSDNFKNLNPEMRYLKFLESRPDLFNRIPQYLMASYLGITPESLSRIRKRMITISKG